MSTLGKHWKLSMVTKKRMSKPRTKKHKENISKAHKKRYEDPKEIEKTSMAMKEFYNDPINIKKISGKNNYNYIDGRCSKDNTPSGMRPEHKRWAKQIRKRDDYTCQLCGKIGLCAHHIDYNPDNFNEDNGVCLCRSHHSKTNTNREYWKKYFKERIKELILS